MVAGLQGQGGQQAMSGGHERRRRRRRRQAAELPWCARCSLHRVCTKVCHLGWLLLVGRAMQDECVAAWLRQSRSDLSRAPVMESEGSEPWIREGQRCGGGFMARRRSCRSCRTAGCDERYFRSSEAGARRSTCPGLISL